MLKVHSANLRGSHETESTRKATFFLVLLHQEGPFFLQVVVGVLGKVLCPDESRKPSPKENTVTDINPLVDSRRLSAENAAFYSPIRSAKYKVKDPEANRNKWRTFGVVLDRFFFLVYLFTLLLAYIFIFPKPHMITSLL